VVREYESQGVRVLHSPERRGKTNALNRAVPLTKGEILFFSDANTHYTPSTLKMMMRNFNDASVGGVSGKKIIRKEEKREATKGEEGFWSYEAFLKTLETNAGSISTSDGEIFSLRRSLFNSIPSHIVHDDMYLTLSIVKAGFRVVYEPDATSEESASKSFKDEFFLKTRYASAGYQIIGTFKDMLLPPRSYFAWQFLSHKLLRWLAPVFLVILYGASAFASSDVVRMFFYLQSAFYALAGLGFALSSAGLPAGPLY
jgi:cellulose synthase/poly-beta-1,6-N-acetylglucosamine synthase-like glycosyltransferase